MTQFERYEQALGTKRFRSKVAAMAQKVAREWGTINSQRKLRIPGRHIWWFSCAGHGGYVEIVAAESVPEWAKPYGDGWTWTWRGAPLSTALVFEEDCDWAVIEYLDAAVYAAALKDRQRWDTTYATEATYRPLVEGSVQRWNRWALAHPAPRCGACEGRGWTWERTDDGSYPDCTVCGGSGSQAA